MVFLTADAVLPPESVQHLFEICELTHVQPQQFSALSVRRRHDCERLKLVRQVHVINDLIRNICDNMS
jgi:hypothetical protein